MTQWVYSDPVRLLEGSFLLGPKCFFSLQDKLSLLFDQFQTLAMAPCERCLDPTHLLPVTFLWGLFFSPFPYSASETLGERSSGQKSRRSPLQTLYDGDQVSSHSLTLRSSVVFSGVTFTTTVAVVQEQTTPLPGMKPCIWCHVA